jgi:predicted transcriptional regulator
MRTTIELSEEHRARLLELAARRGQKGFSGVIEEAVELYLRQDATRNEARRRALGRRGSLGRRDAEQLRAAVEEWRGHWR